MQNEIDILKDVSGKLNSAGIAFMLTGSVAMSYYTIPRMTRDIDIVVAVDRGDTEKLSSLFGSEYYVSEESISDAIRRKSMFNIIHFESVIKVDLIVLNKTDFSLSSFARRSPLMIGDFETTIITREDLILSKLLWAKGSGSEMNDTLPEVAKTFRALMMRRSGIERMQMAADMFDAARMIVMASFPPDLAGLDMKARLCERLYHGEVEVNAFSLAQRRRSF
jgi:hypothetical protein